MFDNYIKILFHYLSIQITLSKHNKIIGKRLQTRKLKWQAETTSRYTTLGEKN